MDIFILYISFDSEFLHTTFSNRIELKVVVKKDFVEDVTMNYWITGLKSMDFSPLLLVQALLIMGVFIDIVDAGKKNTIQVKS